MADLFDGWAARKYNQCSDFGGLLDMITDRCSTAGLLHVLSFEYNNILYNSYFRVLFLGLIILDISSHWCQVRYDYNPTVTFLDCLYVVKEETSRGFFFFLYFPSDVRFYKITITS